MSTLLDLLMQRGLAPTRANSATASALGINPGEIAGMPVGGAGSVASVMGAKTAPKAAGTSKTTGLAGFSERLGKSFNDPLMQFGLNMLANSAPTTAPNSFGQALGRSGLQTMQQQQAQGMSALQKQLLESQIGLANKRAETAGTTKPERKVAATKTLANGNIGYVDAFTGETVDTGAREGNQKKIVEIEGRGKFLFNPITSQLIEMADEETIRDALSGRAGDREAAVIDARQDAENQQELPATIAKNEDFISQGERFIKSLESGDLETGIIRGQFPGVTTEQQLFDAFAGENIIEAIGSATFGALSEGERQFLKSTVISRTKTPEANKEILRRKIEIIRNANERARDKLGQEPTSNGATKRFNPATGKLEAI